MTKIQTGEKALLTKLQALYDIEKTIETALPKMQKAAHDKTLKGGFRTHLAETKMHSKRLEQSFKRLGAKPKKLKCEGIRGIVADGAWVIKNVEAQPAIKDAMLASAARYVEHYEMAGYLSAIAQAAALGLGEIEALLRATLVEEELTDTLLAQSAKQLLQQ